VTGRKGKGRGGKRTRRSSVESVLAARVREDRAPSASEVVLLQNCLRQRVSGNEVGRRDRKEGIEIGREANNSGTKREKRRGWAVRVRRWECTIGNNRE
jgi:hypothetical protein